MSSSVLFVPFSADSLLLASSSADLNGAERAAFVVAALTETVLFAASVLGYVAKMK